MDLRLGRMNLFIGTNASGKSNFLDALRFLQGIGNGFPINDTLDGKPKGATSDVWEGIRGGSAHACFAGAGGKQQVEISVSGVLEESPPVDWMYRVAFLPLENGKIIEEEIDAGEYSRSFSWESGYSIARDGAKCGLSPLLHPGVFADPNEDVTQSLQELDRYLSESMPSGIIAGLQFSKALTTLFSNVQHINPEPEVLRTYAQSNQVLRMGDRGENFAAVVRTICQDPLNKDAYLSWLHQLRPAEVDDVKTLTGALGEPLFALQENGRWFPASVLSDGTLRFAALAASFFQPSMPGLMTMEEIENGIHASRVQLLLELMRTQAEVMKTQIVATTHSATVLDWLQEDDYKTTFFCRRDESTGESKICSLADVPHFLEVVKSTPVSELFSEGWLEMAS